MIVPPFALCNINLLTDLDWEWRQIITKNAEKAAL